jgi:hypothetical protein
VINSLFWILLYLFYRNLELNLLVVNHFIIWEREGAKFDPDQKSLKFVPEIMILVSSANNIDSDMKFILRRRSFIYINYSPTGVHWNMEFPQGSILGPLLFIISSCIRWFYFNFLSSVSSTWPEPIFRYLSSSIEM